MLFTWNTRNLCIVFRQWHIRSTAGLVFSLLAVVALGVGYEALREGIRRYELSVTKRAETAPRKPPPPPSSCPRFSFRGFGDSVAARYPVRVSGARSHTGFGLFCLVSFCFGDAASAHTYTTYMHANSHR